MTKKQRDNHVANIKTAADWLSDGHTASAIVVLRTIVKGLMASECDPCEEEAHENAYKWRGKTLDLDPAYVGYAQARFVVNALADFPEALDEIERCHAEIAVLNAELADMKSKPAGWR